MVMSGLGELSAKHPVAGGFHAHATRDLGPAWGFATAWLYWLCWAVALASEFTAAGLLMQRWFPDVSVWIFSLIFAALLFTLNAISSRVFGESEFWFSLIKVAAVLLVIVVGLATILGINPASEAGTIGFSNFHTEHGLFPTGITGVLVTILSVFYAFSGTELIGVAAGEAKDPQLSIPRAIRTAVVRLTVFFIGAIVVVAAIIPWAQAGANESPFVTILDVAGLPAGADLMNFVIITALLSAGNSGLYSCARMLHSMGAAGQAPKALSKTNNRGIPMLALSLSMLGGLVSLLSSVIAAESLFLALVSVAGFAVVAVWIVICASHISFRRHYVAEHGSTDSLPYKAPLFPILPIIALILLTASLLGVGFDPVQRATLYFGVPFTLACLGYYRWRHGAGVFSPQREVVSAGTNLTA